MVKHLLLLVSLLFVVLFSTFAIDQEMYPADSAEYRTILLLSRISGTSPLSDSAPYSLLELQQMFKSVQKENLNANEISIYNNLQLQLYQQAQSSSLSVPIIFSPEFYGHLNNSEFFDEDDEWIISYTKRLPVLAVGLDLSHTDSLFSRIRYEVKENRFSSETGDSSTLFGNSFSTNLLFEEKGNANLTEPWTAYLSVGNLHWNVQFGRDTICWGSAIEGNLMINDHVDYHEFLKFTTYNKQFKLTSAALVFDHPDNYTISSNSPSPTSTDPITGIKMFITHRLEIPVAKFLRIAISEGMMVQSPINGEEDAPTFKLSWLNPFMIFHNFYMAGSSNSLAGISFTANVLPGLSIYGEFVIDEVGVSTETNTKPDAFGYTGGVSYTGSLKNNLFSTTFEAILTDPYFYLRTDPDYLVGQRQPVSSQLILAKEDFIGFPLGPDTLSLELAFTLQNIKKWEAGSSIRYIQKGTVNATVPYETGTAAASLTTPTTSNPGDPSKDSVEHRLIWSLKGNYSISSNLEIGCSAVWIHRWNPENIKANPSIQDLQAAVHATYKLL